MASLDLLNKIDHRFESGAFASIALRPCPFHATLCISDSNPQEYLLVDKVMTVVDNNNTGLKIEKDVHVTIYSVCFIFICSLIIKGDDLYFKKIKSHL